MANKKFDDDQVDFEKINELIETVMHVSGEFENLINDIVSDNIKLKKELSRLRSSTRTLASKINNAFYVNEDFNIDLD